MNNGWIKLHRQLLEWEWFDDHNTFRLFLYLLLKASHTPKKWRSITIQPGDLRTTVGELATNLGLSTQNVRTSLDKLKSTNEITIKSTNRNTVISINNWNGYQQINDRDNKQLTNNQQTTNKPTSGLKNVKKEKNVKNNTELKEFLDLFNSLYGSKYTQTAGRAKKLSLRLKTYSFEQIKKSLENLSTSEWHQGKNDRGWKADPDFLLRNDEQIDKWLNFVPDKKAKPKKVFFLQSELDEMNPVERNKAVQAMKGSNAMG